MVGHNQNQEILLASFCCKDASKGFKNAQYLSTLLAKKKICTIINFYCYIEFATSLYSMCINIFT